MPRFFNHIELDEFQIMPNHMHGIIIINKRPDSHVDFNTNVGAKHPEENTRIYQTILPTDALPLQGEQLMAKTRDASPLPRRPQGTKSGSIAAVIQNYCSVTTRKINRINSSKDVNFWQRDYFEHIVRDADEMNRIRTYIEENSLKWENDKYYSE